MAETKSKLIIASFYAPATKVDSELLGSIVCRKDSKNFGVALKYKVEQWLHRHHSNIDDMMEYLDKDLKLFSDCTLGCSTRKIQIELDTLTKLSYWNEMFDSNICFKHEDDFIKFCVRVMKEDDL